MTTPKLSIVALFILVIVCAFTSASIVGSGGNNYQYNLTYDDLERAQVDNFGMRLAAETTGHCEPFSQKYCSDVIPYGTSIYVPDNKTQQELSTEFEQSLFLLRVASSYNDCDVALYAYMCAKIFPLCTVDTENTAQLNPPCYPLCKRFNETCSRLVDRYNLISPELRPVCGQPNDMECGLHVSPLVTRGQATPPTPTTCPEPLVVPQVSGDPTILDGTCAEPCPILSWSKSEYQKMDIVSEVLGLISLLCSGFITLTWLCFPKLRQKQYIFWFFICSFFLSLFLWIGLRLRGTDTAASVHCETNTREFHMAGYCVFQGMTTIFFMMAGTAWWTVQSLDVFLKVVVGMRLADGSKYERLKEIIYHVVCWGIGAICTIGALSFQQIGGYGIGASFCLFSLERRGVPRSPDVSYGFFYYPLIIMCSIGLLSMAGTFIKLVIFKFSAKSGITASAFIRIFLLVITMMGVFIVILVYKFMAADRISEWQKSAEEFYTCLLFNVNNPYSTIDCGTSPSERMPLGLKFLYDLIPLAPGLLVFICYGLVPELYFVWFGWFYEKCGCTMFKKYSKDGKTNANTNSYTGSTRGNASQSGTTNRPGGASTTAAVSKTGAGSTSAQPKKALFGRGAYAAYSSRPATNPGSSQQPLETSNMDVTSSGMNSKASVNVELQDISLQEPIQQDKAEDSDSDVYVPADDDDDAPPPPPPDDDGDVDEYDSDQQ